ncbi:MAG: glutamate synthase-related protein [Thermoguttaceae bacterium]
MPAKYSIHTKAAPPRFRPVGKLGIVDWREDCSNCHNCVKRSCVYGLYRDELDTLRDEPGYLDYIYQCKGCLSCIQNCTKNILTRVVNPEFQHLGDAYYTPDIIVSTWYQAEAGRIPVSGSGYGGRFSGPGFDSMWTDMSEIVRPTRDGIHGREYIHTGVDIGRKPARLDFTEGAPDVAPPPLVECPLPVIFDLVPPHWRRGPVVAAILRAAAELGTLAVVRPEGIPAGLALEQEHIIPLLETGAGPDLPAVMAMIPDGDQVAEIQAALKAENPEQVVAIRMHASPHAAQRIVELARGGAEVLHLVFDSHGRENAAVEGAPQGGEETASGQQAAAPRHMRDVLREVHRALVKAGIRDEVTLIASGGIALPEHMAKAIICGADLVAVDIPLVVALECRLCGECEHGEACPIALERMDGGLATRRIVNLIGAWHQQLIEVLGAMGIREVRRLRGETGRAMFFEDLERDTFGKMFGPRKVD